MVSLCLNSLPLPPPSSCPKKLTETSSSFSNGSIGTALKPIVVNGNPPTFVSAPGRLGDLHGDLDQARYALEMAGVLSSDGQDLWTGEDALGDVLDRGDDEIAILSLLRSLGIQAKAKGGAVFQVNGNHETMNVEGDFRYVESGAFDECADFLEYLNDYEYDWDEAFVRWCGVSRIWKDERKMSRNHWGPWNLVKRQKGVIARSVLFRPGGPLACELARHAVALKINAILQETLQALGAKAMVVGHTPQFSGANCLPCSEYNCSIWRIDVGMSSGVLNSRPEVLEIRDDKARVIRSKRNRFSELQMVDYL
ncbi:hypothetical protein GOBAR_AA07436 [Gossypium barbadense]|uniref:Calcineurin-like phosphoesterase domain-containing protein n=1 Tax=Gossypium barbadense TaxID=3634 RepID=A0A2P5YCF9_GOSBA|nr:hypothetical protein GOBAR_AA07436 [Gossypium barbadense]